MKVTDMFPSRFGCGSDLPGPLVVTIAGISVESMALPGQGPKDKFVLFFKETRKPIILNKTIAKQISKVLGENESDSWVGKKIEIYPVELSVGGEMRIGIRVRAADQEPPSKQPKA